MLCVRIESRVRKLVIFKTNGRISATLTLWRGLAYSFVGYTSTSNADRSRPAPYFLQVDFLLFMNSKSSNSHRLADFVLQTVDQRYYVNHLPTKTIFYIHSASYSYPDGIDEGRYHHPVRSECAIPEFYLIVQSSFADLSILWMIVLEAEFWFRNEGLILLRSL
ncbi:hypothetical protein FHW89_001406 [Mucilaginibacter sp. SG564]|nr:hypothetical protein [Mucilaginibacter sp. SG564]